jgi:hypothetical protein
MLSTSFKLWPVNVAISGTVDQAKASLMTAELRKSWNVKSSLMPALSNALPQDERNPYSGPRLISGIYQDGETTLLGSIKVDLERSADRDGDALRLARPISSIRFFTGEIRSQRRSGGRGEWSSTGLDGCTVRRSPTISASTDRPFADKHGLPLVQFHKGQRKTM